MTSQVEQVVNAWYKIWCSLHDPFTDDFEGELYKVIPDLHFTYIPETNYWILIGER